MTPAEVVLLLAAASVAFTLSASAGLGGSLILVPAAVLILGPKHGIACAALLLAVNNVGKVVAYWAHVPWREALGMVCLTMIGSAVGARLLVTVDAEWVAYGAMASIGLTFVFEWRNASWRRVGWAPVLAFGAGATSGFSGTSGPLKGIALRSLALKRRALVGAASIASLAGDATKTVVYARAGLLDQRALLLIALACPVVIGAVVLGRRINHGLKERGYAVMFWLVMAGYTARLVV